MSIYNKLGATMSATGSTTWTGIKAGTSAVADTTGDFIKSQDLSGVAANAGSLWRDANKASKGYLNHAAGGAAIGMITSAFDSDTTLAQGALAGAGAGALALGAQRGFDRVMDAGLKKVSHYTSAVK